MAEKEYIEREAVLAYMSEVKAACISNFEDEASAVIAGMIGEIKDDEIPAADVEPVRHGHWIEEYDCGYTTPHCSECGETALTKEETSYDYVYSSYCPHCGAKMDGGDNE